jgi:hypothetical protein
VSQTVTKYVKELDSNEDESIKEFELELFCAIANDTATHIEEVKIIYILYYIYIYIYINLCDFLINYFITIL